MELFGGGNARLELTSDDMLEAGVSIVARPPGKRNTSIHQLSGGEKALTALALIFTIFKLKPSPFCLLDEVDAPLDDNNTLRFSTMLKKMSSYVQFVYVTHNKITMEAQIKMFLSNAFALRPLQKFQNLEKSILSQHHLIPTIVRRQAPKKLRHKTG